MLGIIRSKPFENVAEEGNVRKYSARHSLMRLRHYLWPSNRKDLKRRIYYAFAALAASKLISLLTPVFFKLTTDEISESIVDNTIEQAMLVVVMLIVAYGCSRLISVVFAQVRDALFSSVAQNAVRQLATATFEHLHRLSLRFHLERKTGGLSRVVERATRGIETLVRFAMLNTFPTIIEIFMLVGIFWFYYDYRFVLLLLAMVVGYSWFTFYASEKRMAFRRDMNNADTDSNTKAVDSLLNFETVKYFTNEASEARRFDNAMATYEKAAIRSWVSLSYLNSGQIAIFTVGLTLCMILSAQGVTSGEFTLGDLVMINGFLIQLYQPLNFLGTVYREIRQAIFDIGQMFELLDEKPEIVDQPKALPLQVSKAVVEFKDVHFYYEADRPILKGVNFTVESGQTVAIVGPSGAGKSTLSRLLFRFYDVQEGSICIDGQNIREVTQLSLRSSIGIVPQDTVLFNDTISYNIRYGRLDASDEEIREAARLAQIDQFISQLPQGFNTMVGERGLKLSGGEKQRVAIARTLLKAPPIIVLDEATSALDTHTEKEIQLSLDQVSKGRTSLVIAHRLSTIINADEIIVLENGQVAERGTHKALLAKKSIYANLWHRQQQVDEAKQLLVDEGIITGVGKLR